MSMARKSSHFRRVAQMLSPGERPLVLLELQHALLAEPMRFVNSAADVLSNGHNYVAAAFEFTWPDDQDKQTPAAALSISNGGGGVGAFFERTHGGRGATVRVMQVLPSAPDFVEDDLELDLHNIEVTTMTVSGQLGYDDVLNKTGVAYTYRPETAPGIF